MFIRIIKPNFILFAVMALFPQTTCLYKALVNQLPTSVLDDYELIFEDSNFPEGYAPPIKVAQR